MHYELQSFRALGFAQTGVSQNGAEVPYSFKYAVPICSGVVVDLLTITRGLIIIVCQLNIYEVPFLGFRVGVPYAVRPDSDRGERYILSKKISDFLLRLLGKQSHSYESHDTVAFSPPSQ